MIMSSCRLSRPFSKEERGFISRTSVGNRYFTEVELSTSINVKKKNGAKIFRVVQKGSKSDFASSARERVARTANAPLTFRKNSEIFIVLWFLLFIQNILRPILHNQLVLTKFGRCLRKLIRLTSAMLISAVKGTHKQMVLWLSCFGVAELKKMAENFTLCVKPNFCLKNVARIDKNTMWPMATAIWKLSAKNKLPFISWICPTLELNKEASNLTCSELGNISMTNDSLLDLHNSPYHTQLHPIISNKLFCHILGRRLCL